MKGVEAYLLVIIASILIFIASNTIVTIFMVNINNVVGIIGISTFVLCNIIILIRIIPLNFIVLMLMH